MCVERGKSAQQRVNLEPKSAIDISDFWHIWLTFWRVHISVFLKNHQNVSKMSYTTNWITFFKILDSNCLKIDKTSILVAPFSSKKIVHIVHYLLLSLLPQ